MKLTREMMEQLTKDLTDKGKLIEAGFVGLRIAVIPPEAPIEQVRDMRMAFMAGAQHLFASLMSVFEPGTEPTEADMNRAELIHNEMAAFVAELSERVHGKSN